MINCQADDFQIDQGPCSCALSDYKPYFVQAQALYTALVVRRVLCAMLDPSLIDDRDYYGNKRLELAGGLLALLFEDLFKRMCTDLRKEVPLPGLKEYNSLLTPPA